MILCKLPQLRKVAVLLCEESHLAIVANRCPNIQLLTLRTDNRVAFGSMFRMKSIGKFTNLVILDILCGKVIPPLSTLHKLRELILYVTHDFSSSWCSLFLEEVPKSVRFLSLDMINAEIAEMILNRIELIVLRVSLHTTYSAFEGFLKAFPLPRENPNHIAVKADASCLWNGNVSQISPCEGSFFFRRRYLSYE